jgi:hypothetical protein
MCPSNGDYASLIILRIMEMADGELGPPWAALRNWYGV